MTREIRCEGAPRDLGFDQGRACREELHTAFAGQSPWRRWRQRLGVSAATAKPLIRDLKRHFPQHSETVEGMVFGAGVPYAWFAEELERALAAEPPTSVGDALAVALDSSLTTFGSCVARSLACEPLVRRSRPEGGFASVELALPWSSAALLGVNDAGLAAASVSLAGEPSPNHGCAVPAPLLVQDCLARFDSVDGAMDWCLGRPAGRRATILLADASGRVVAVEIDGDARREAPMKDGLVLAGGAEAAGDALRAATSVTPADVAIALGDSVACADPAGRRIGILGRKAAAHRWFDVAAPA